MTAEWCPRCGGTKDELVNIPGLACTCPRCAREQMLELAMGAYIPAELWPVDLLEEEAMGADEEAEQHE